MAKVICAKLHIKSVFSLPFGAHHDPCNGEKNSKILPLILGCMVNCSSLKSHRERNEQKLQGKINYQNRNFSVIYEKYSFKWKEFYAICKKSFTIFLKDIRFKMA